MIGGNTKALLQVKTTSKNEIGESVPTWETVNELTGWLDFLSGGTGYTNYNAKIQESTHVFVSDYENLDERVTSENSRLVINNKNYDVTLIDNPMELGYQLELYLKLVGV